MEVLPSSVSKLIDAFSQLPGIGPKTAARLTFYLLHAPDEVAFGLSEALVGLKENTVLCERCFNITEKSPCPICSDPSRDQTTICVVEEPLDVVAIERTGAYHGLYHVLHGTISPVEGIGPDDLKIRELLDRLKREPVQEVILATNPTMEGEATALYLVRQIAPLGIKVTRLARGLPVGGDLEYADDVTLTRAMEGRQEF